MLSQHDRELIITRMVGGTAVIRINRPDKYNALTQGMYLAMVRALRQADNDSAARSIVITGTGKAFTAGNDLDDFAIEADGDTPVQRFLRTIAQVRLPVVAAVNGLAVGVGVTMLLHCDLVYACPEAKFQVPFVDVGLVPEAGSTLLLPRLIGERRSAELFLTGRQLLADEARTWGLINEVAPTPVERAIEVAHLIATKPPLAVQRTKSLGKSEAADVFARMDEEERLLSMQLQSSEFRDAMAARRENRRPRL